MLKFKNLKLVANLLAIFLAIVLVQHNAFAQKEPTSKTIQVYVTKLQQSTNLLTNFITQKKGIVYNTNLSDNKYYTQFSIPLTDLNSLDSLANVMGYVRQNSYNTQNIQEEINKLQSQIDGLKFENNIYLRQIADSVYIGNAQKDITNKITNNLRNIASLEVNINKLELSANDQMCKVQFTINDELSTPNNSRVSFVNMPGIEYGYLFIENPMQGISAKGYQGATIKYMFTRGKSYFNLGVYRAINNNTSDTSLINELFMINFGQDFYPRNFGRGKRRFLNLYTGYQIGGFISNQNNNQNSKFIPNANLSFGVELIKTKHILVDNKVSYFLPLNELNRNMRGILYQASFNFVF